MNSDILMALIISKEKFEANAGHKATVFICSQQLADEIGTETVLRRPVEIDECLYGLNSFYWM